MLTSLLYLLIFSHVLESHVAVFDGKVGYTAFLVPGLVMMSVLQNAFANSSSSLIQSKITGNLDLRAAPAAVAGELFAAYVLGAMVRGLVVGLGVFAVTLFFAPSLLDMPHPLWALAFALLGSAILGTLGLIAGIWADKFDQLAAFQNFVIMPLTFLSGVFYSIHSLPPFWQAASHFNPFFYMIDGFRYGFFGVADTSPEAEPRHRRRVRARARGADAALLRAAGSCALRTAARRFRYHRDAPIQRSLRLARHAPTSPVAPESIRASIAASLAASARGPRRRPSFRGPDRLARRSRASTRVAAISSCTQRSATACARKSTRCRCARSRPRSGPRSRRSRDDADRPQIARIGRQLRRIGGSVERTMVA